MLLGISTSIWSIDMTVPYGKDSIRFKIRNVIINGQSDQISLAKGGSIQVSLEVYHNCPRCGGALNQVIVGLAGESKAQACVWDGMNYSSGIPAFCRTDKGKVYSGCSLNRKPAVWEKKKFSLILPNKAGTYYIRARYAQAYGCPGGALGWWKVDLPNGPTENANIGIVKILDGTKEENPDDIPPPPPAPGY